MIKKIEEIAKIVVYPVFIYLNIDFEMVAILASMMLFDSFVGSIKAYRLEQSFEFRILLWGIVLKILILSIPIIVALLGRALNYDLTILVDMTIQLMIVSEAYSIFGNIYSAKNKIEVNKLDAISIILKTIRKALFLFIQNSIKKIENSSDCNFKDRNDLRDKADQI